MKKIHQIFAWLPLVLMVNVALAEEDVFFADMPIVASVSRLPQKLSEAPASVTVIDRDMIRASGFRTVEDLLRLVPGFQVSSHNQDSGIATYHGLNTGLNGEEYGVRLQVLVDGRSQYSPLFKSGVNWNLLPVVVENIERIEVIRGANTVAYGSNAFMGVVNIITQDTSQTKGWMFSANHGLNFIRDETLRWGGKVGNADVRFSYHALGDEGFQHAFYADWTDPHDSRQSKLFDLKVDFALSNKDNVQVTLTHAKDVSQFGRPDRPTTDPFRDLKQDSTSLGVQWRRVVNADEELKVLYAYTEDRASSPYSRVAGFDYYRPPPALTTPITFNMNVDPGGKSTVSELEFQYLISPFDKTRFMFGGAVKTLGLYSPDQFSTTDWKRRDAYRMFGNVELRPAKDWLFNLGASLEHDSLTGLHFDPRASISYHLTKEQTVRLAASRAHRTPSLYEYMGRVEFKATGTTSPIDLKYLGQGVESERLDTLEVGYLAELKAARASFDLRGFIEKIPNRIQILPLSLPASSPDNAEGDNIRSTLPFGRADGAINLERVVITGYEYQIRWQPFENTRLLYNRALICIDADLTDISVVADAANNIGKISQQGRESAPVHSQSAMLMQKLPYDIQASVMYFRNSTMRWRRNGPPLQASERFDWRLAKSFNLGSSSAELAYTVQMNNESLEGRFGGLRYADKLHWLSLRLDF